MKNYLLPPLLVPGRAKRAAPTPKPSALMSLYDTLPADIAKLNELTLGGLAANLNKTLDQIYKKQETWVTSEGELEVMARQRFNLQKEKAEEDYALFVAKESGDMYKQIEGQARADLEKYKGFAGAKEVIDAATARKKLEEDTKNREAILSLQKIALEGIAQEAPLLSQQLDIKTKLPWKPTKSTGPGKTTPGINVERDYQ